MATELHDVFIKIDFSAFKVICCVLSAVIYNISHALPTPLFEL